ncbi:MAG: fumarylacetoacetate hydrolase family protein [Erythrobacter sp.]
MTAGGPWLVLPLPEELARWRELELVLAVNGEQRQRSLAGEMIFKPAETLAELSRIMDLAAGDLIATGTPGGVALHPPSGFVQALAGFLTPAKRFRAFMKGQLPRAAYLRDGQVMTAAIRTQDGAIDLGAQRNLIRPAGQAGLNWEDRRGAGTLALSPQNAAETWVWRKPRRQAGAS